jgi:hypothetical protein
MKKQIFTIITLLVVSTTIFGQFKLDATGSNDMRLRTNSLDRLNILTNGNVGIGTATPASLFHTFVGDAGTVSPRTGTIGTLETNASTGYLSILTPATAQAGIAFGSPVGNANGSLNYNHATKKLTLANKATTRMTIDSTGNVGINETSPDAKLEVNGDVHIIGDLRFKENYKLLTTATHDPFLREDRSYIMIYNSTGATVTTIKGFDAPDYTAKYGTILYLTNDYNGSIVLKHNVAAVAANGIETNTGSDVTITSNGGATFIYSNERWRLISYAQ